MKRHSMRKVLCGLLVSMLALGLPVRALAADYNLVDGSISINARDDGQYVSQENGVTGQKDDAPVIHTSAQTGNNVTISSEGSATASVTIKDVDINTKKTGIDVTDGSKAEITVSGDNSINASSTAGAAVHVGDQSQVTITSKDNGKLEASSAGTGIGTYSGEAYTGSTTFGGNVDVKAEGSMGAGVGSGYGGGASGNVTAQENAKLEADGNWGAGVGAGGGGSYSGNFTAKDNTVVDVNGGVGKGEIGRISNDAKINILGNACVTADSIGTDDPDNKVGTLTMSESATLNGTQGSAMASDSLPMNLTVASQPNADTPHNTVAAADSVEWNQGSAHYWVTDRNGNYLRSQAEEDNGVLTITAEAGYAVLNAKDFGLAALRDLGVQTIVFVTEGAASTMEMDAVIAGMPSGLLTLTHDGQAADLVLNGEAHNELLK